MIAPPFLSAPCPDISPVWDIVPHDTYLSQATWTHSGGRIAAELSEINAWASIAWTWVHAIVRSSTCAMSIISGSNQRAYQSPRGDAWSVRSPSNGLWSSSNGRHRNLHRDLHRWTVGGGSSLWSRIGWISIAHLTWSSIQRQRKLMEELHDRAAIEEFLSWNRLHLIGRRSMDDQDHDRGPIVEWAWFIWSKNCD